MGNSDSNDSRDQPSTVVRAIQALSMDDATFSWARLCGIMLLGHDHLLHVLGRGAQ